MTIPRTSVRAIVGLLSWWGACLPVLFLSETALSSPISISELTAVDFGNRIIDSIEIRNLEIFDTEQPRYDNILFRMANSMHIKTREKAIRRELLFKEGDLYNKELAEETARNLRTRLAIADARVEPMEITDDRLLVRVTTIDEWSLLLTFDFSREDSRTDYRLGLEERNLGGNQQFFGLNYFIREGRGDFLDTRFRDRRVGGLPLVFDAYFRANPEDRARRLVIGQPFYNLSQRKAWLTEYAHLGGPQESFVGLTKNADWEVRGDTAGISTFTRWGEYRRKVGAGFDYSYKSQIVSNEAAVTGLPDSLAFDTLSFPGDSLIHLLAFSVGYQDFSYVSLRRVRGYSYLEDFELGLDSRLKIGRAFTRGFRGYQYNELTAAARIGKHYRRHLGILSAQHTYYFRQRELRRVTSAELLLYSPVTRFLTLAGRGRVNTDYSDDMANRLQLEGGTRLKGRESPNSQGNRRVEANFEGRIWPGVELLSVIFGAVLYVDVARAWQAGEPFRLEKFNTAYGLGIRIAPEALTKADLIRIDFSRLSNEWEITFGTGQYF